LTEAGNDVKVIPTQNALRFIGATTLEAISHNAVDADLYTDVESVKHIALAQEAEVLVVAPATASFIARYAAGIADDLLLNVLLATKAKVVIAPAMHTEMWEHPSTQDNIRTLISRGVIIVGPGFGRLTGEDSGVGRLAESEEIANAVLGLRLEQDYKSKRVLVVTGGTREPIDSVRYIGNRSSGKQGLALADEALARGASVKLIAINLDQDLSRLESVEKVSTSAQVELSLLADLNFDLILMPAAISDFKVVEPNPGKLHRSETGEFTLSLEANEDIIRKAAQQSSKNVCLVGFAAHTAEFESESLLAAAQRKLETKGVDVIVANDVSNGAVFDSESNSVVIVTRDSNFEVSGSKRQVARGILDFVRPLLEVE
jgi:phosphopantothenoylcysteine decarboxylase/phosphopantothenate--cysteine ligase